MAKCPNWYICGYKYHVHKHALKHHIIQPTHMEIKLSYLKYLKIKEYIAILNSLILPLWNKNTACRILRVLMMVYNTQSYRVSGLCPLFGILGSGIYVSKTGSASMLR
jgi:hypothetical protein